MRAFEIFVGGIAGNVSTWFFYRGVCYLIAAKRDKYRGFGSSSSAPLLTHPLQNPYNSAGPTIRKHPHEQS